MAEFWQAIQMLFGENAELRLIILTTLELSVLSTSISCCIGIPLGILIANSEFRLKRLLLRIISTLMGLPPVVAGLIVFMLLSRSGPLGTFKLLYSMPAMVIAQVFLITPIVTGLTQSAAAARAPQLKETAAGIGLSRAKQLKYLFLECRPQLISVALTGFGRAISEVGAVQLVGGNVQYKTRVMTTAIMLETNKGNFELAIALGIVLLIIAFFINWLAQRLQEERKPKRRRVRADG